MSPPSLAAVSAMLSSALGALGRRSGGLLRLAPAALPAAPLRLVVPAVAQRFSLACWNPPRARAWAIWTSTEEQPPKYLVPILAAGAVAAVLLPDATGCMGKKKKKILTRLTICTRSTLLI